MNNRGFIIAIMSFVLLFSGAIYAKTAGLLSGESDTHVIEQNGIRTSVTIDDGKEYTAIWNQNNNTMQMIEKDLETGVISSSGEVAIGDKDFGEPSPTFTQ